MSRLIYALPLIVLIIIGAISLKALNSDDRDDMPSTMIGREAPEIAIAPLADFPTPEADGLYRNSKITLVNFFASWCAPCRAEHPLLTELALEGVPIIGVNYKDIDGNAVKFIEELGNPYQKITTDKSGRTAFNWGVSGVPETFVVDENGIVIHRVFGPLTREQLETDLRPLLAD